jgi:hypothetical protein
MTIVVPNVVPAPCSGHVQVTTPPDWEQLAPVPVAEAETYVADAGRFTVNTALVAFELDEL